MIVPHDPCVLGMGHPSKRVLAGVPPRALDFTLADRGEDALAQW